MISTMSYEMERKRSCGSCLRYCMIVVNIIFALIAATVVGVFLYLHITQVDFVSAVLGTDMVVVASFLVIVSGCLLLLMSIFGLIIAIVDKVTPYAVYIGFVVTIFCIMASGVICALVFKTWLTEEVRHQMQETLQTVYGVNLDDSWNRKVTESWDKAQTLWQCCSVDDQSWDLYHDSLWYKEQEGTPGSPVNPRPYVPPSCCVLDSSGQISETNLRKCQTTIDGPPARRQGSQYAGRHNSALNYRGCYEAAQDYLINDTVSWFSVLVGVGSTICILLVLGIILSVVMYTTKKKEMKNKSYIAAYSNRLASQYSLENHDRY